MPKSSTDTGSANESLIYDNTSSFVFEGRKSSAWMSDKFSGSHSRQISDDVLTFKVEQFSQEGGLDVGLSLSASESMLVERVADGTSICSSYDIDLSGKGRWWAGPKISVNWQGDESAKENGDDWYENYIIETASTSPEELHDILTDDYFSPKILPDIVISGATYRTYKIRFHDWWQFWSVRQDFRETGVVQIKPILYLWAEHGLPTDRQFDGVKANVETYGKISGSGRLAINVSTDPNKPLDCRI